MKNIAEVLEGVKTVGIGGHIRPDGDCVGSCMALYLYIRTYFPDIDVTVYLDHPKPIFGHIECIDEIKTEADDRVFDLFITCDVSARDRLALAGDLFEKAKKTVCIDHHVSNQGFADINMGRGAIVIGLAAVIIGEAIFGRIFRNFALTLLSVGFGAVIYYLVLQVVIWLGVDTDLLKMFSAIVVAIFLAIPYWKSRYFAKPVRRGGSADA